MRTIKFRGKMSDGGRWLYGSLLTWPDGDVYILHDVNYTTSGTLNKDPVLPDTVGQFTGLLDKNGKEIYEGDIVTMMRTPKKKRKRILVRHIIRCKIPSDWSFQSLDSSVLDMLMTGFSNNDSYMLEVVGNIHDNTELAEKNTN